MACCYRFVPIATEHTLVGSLTILRDVYSMAGVRKVVRK